MFKNEKKNALMAMAVVAVFIFSAFAIMLAPSDASGDSENDAVIPTLEGANSYTSSNNGMDVLMTVYASDATKITYDWGDGTSNSNNIRNTDNTFYSANHTYAQAGTYQIKVTASNENGDASYVTTYYAGVIDDIEFPPVNDNTFKLGKISSTTVDDEMTLKANVIVSDPLTTTIEYKWFMKEKDAEEEEPIIESETFTLNPDGSLGIKIADDYPLDDTKFILKVSVLFDGETEPVEKSVSYTYKDTSTFMENHGLLFIVFIVLAILVFALTYFGFQFIPYQYAIGFILIVVAVVAFLTNDFGLALWKF